MKYIQFFLCSLLLTGSFACSGDVDSPPQPEPWAGQTRLLTLETYLYNSANSQTPPEKALLSIDSASHTITTWIEHAVEGGGFERREFDQNWRLVKIVTYDKSYALPERRDSIMITRPGPGMFEFTRENGEVSQYTIQSTPDGGKLIQQTILNDEPQYFHRRIVDKKGLLVYSGIYQKYEDRTIRDFHHFTYNGNGQLTSVRDTSYFDDGSIYAFQHTITKSNVTSPRFISLMNQMAGTDLDWTLYDFYNPVPPFGFTYEFSNLVFMQNGFFAENALTIRISTDGGISYKPGEENQPMIYEVATDASGRLTTFSQFERGYRTKKMNFRYFD